MAWNGTGTYLRIHNWVADAAVPIDITASRMDAEDDSIAAGINNCIAKDGQNAATADLPMGSNKHTSVGNASARDQYAAVGQVQDGAFQWEGTETGAADAYAITPAPAITAYAAGQRFSFIPANTNTGASTLAVSGLAAKDIKLINGADPAAGDIVASGVNEVQYDGTNFVLLNPGSASGAQSLVVGDGTSTTLEIASGLGGLEYEIEAVFASDNGSGGTYEIEINADTTAANYYNRRLIAGVNVNNNLFSQAGEPLVSNLDQIAIKGRIWSDNNDTMQFEFSYLRALAGTTLYGEHMRGNVLGTKASVTAVAFKETVSGGNFTSASYIRLKRVR